MSALTKKLFYITVLIGFLLCPICSGCGSESMVEGTLDLRNIQFTEKWLEKENSAIVPMAKIQCTDFTAGNHEYFTDPRSVRLKSVDYYEAIPLGSPYYAVRLSFNIPKKTGMDLGLVDSNSIPVFENVLKSDEYTARYVTVTLVAYTEQK